MIVILLCNIRYVTEKVILWKVFECGSCFISSWNMVIWVTIILKRTCVDIDWCFDNLCCSRYSEWSKWVVHVGWYWPDWLISRPLSKWGRFQYHETSIYNYNHRYFLFPLYWMLVHCLVTPCGIWQMCTGWVAPTVRSSGACLTVHAARREQIRWSKVNRTASWQNSIKIMIIIIIISNNNNNNDDDDNNYNKLI